MVPETLAVGMVTVPVNVGEADGAAPDTSVTGRVPVVKALLLDAYTAPPLVKVLNPVPPAELGRVPEVSALALDA
jgi:hypothetical protein